MTTYNAYNREVLQFRKNGKSLFLEGEGYCPEGNRPFVDRHKIATGKTERQWRVDGKSTCERIVRVTDTDLTILTGYLGGESAVGGPPMRATPGSEREKLTSGPIPYMRKNLLPICYLNTTATGERPGKVTLLALIGQQIPYVRQVSPNRVASGRF